MLMGSTEEIVHRCKLKSKWSHLCGPAISWRLSRVSPCYFPIKARRGSSWPQWPWTPEQAGMKNEYMNEKKLIIIIIIYFYSDFSKRSTLNSWIIHTIFKLVIIRWADWQRHSRQLAPNGKYRFWTEADGGWSRIWAVNSHWTTSSTKKNKKQNPELPAAGLCGPGPTSWCHCRGSH